MFLQKVVKRMKEISSPLKKGYLPVSKFGHDITYGKNQLSLLTDNELFLDLYVKNKFPIICTNEEGRTLPNGIYLNRILESHYKDCTVLLPIILKRFNYSHSVHVVIRELDCQHLFSFGYVTDENTFFHWMINNVSQLQDFIDDYNFKMKDIILEAKENTNRIIVPNYINSDFDISTLNEQRLCINHKTSKLPLHLSGQQSDCLIQIMQGKSAKKIAVTMKLSPRTVEHYTENIRKILGCATTNELISDYYGQCQYAVNIRKNENLI